MLLQFAVVDQVRQHPLHDGIALAQGHRSGALKGLDEIRRGNDVAATKRAAQRFGQRADVDHMPLRAVAGQRQIGAAGKVVLMVIVFFDDAEIMQSGQFQELLTTPGTQADGGRELVVRGEIDHPHAVQPAQVCELIDTATFVIQVNGDQSRAQLTENFPGRGVAQAFDHHHIAGF